MPFMAYSTGTASDITHPRYFEIFKMLHGTPAWHRKQWEWVYIICHLLEAGVLTE